jgi:hypothetical protein
MNPLREDSEMGFSELTDCDGSGWPRAAVYPTRYSTASLYQILLLFSEELINQSVRRRPAVL